MPQSVENSFSRLNDVVNTLLGKDGCPWDKDQTPMSMRQYLIEEVFEACDAITGNDSSHAREELGDVFLNALMTARMYEKNGDFTVSEVFDEVSEKLIRRHPHVFSESSGKSEMNEKVVSSGQVMNQWDRIKANVEGRSTQSVLDEVPEGFPPLLKACKMLKKAAKKNFEWNSIGEVEAKVCEEWEEVKEARCEVEKAKAFPDARAYTHKSGSDELNKAHSHLEEEIGDLLFSIINYSIWNGVDPECAMNRAVSKFYRRFTYVEHIMDEKDIPMDKNHLEEMINLWNEAKKQ